MNKKFFSILQDRCKDFGLSEKAIEDLAKAGSEGITDETSDEDIQKKADSLVPYAKLMQAEVTRKAQKVEPQPKQTAKQQQQQTQTGGGSDDNNGEVIPEWFRKYKAETDSSLEALKQENTTLKAERAKANRASEITSKAKSLGIPDFLMKRISLADDADIEKELTEYKQELVTNKLMPAEQADLRSSSDQVAKDEAEAWAKALP